MGSQDVATRPMPLARPCPVIGFAARSHVVDLAFRVPCFANTESYAHAIADHGGAPLMIPSVPQTAALDRLYSLLDGLLLTGGPDLDPAAYGQTPHAATGAGDPALEQAEFYLLRRALADRLPILGICRGLQLLNVALGGTLYQDIAAEYASTGIHPGYDPTRYGTCAHRVCLVEGSALHAVVGRGEIEVNSLHHQGLRDVAPGLAVTATAPDGLVEAVEMPDRPFVVAVQWHPEGLYRTEATWARLFEAFVATAAEHRGRHCRYRLTGR